MDNQSYLKENTYACWWRRPTVYSSTGMHCINRTWSKWKSRDISSDQQKIPNREEKYTIRYIFKFSNYRMKDKSKLLILFWKVWFLLNKFITLLQHVLWIVQSNNKRKQSTLSKNSWKQPTTTASINDVST